MGDEAAGRLRDQARGGRLATPRRPYLLSLHDCAVATPTEFQVEPVALHCHHFGPTPDMSSSEDPHLGADGRLEGSCGNGALDGHRGQPHDVMNGESLAPSARQELGNVRADTVAGDDLAEVVTGACRVRGRIPVAAE